MHSATCVRQPSPCARRCSPPRSQTVGSLTSSSRGSLRAQCPLAEYINLSPNADVIAPYFGGLFTDEPLPKDGFIDLPDRPGFGVTLIRDQLHRPYARSLAASMNNAAATQKLDPPCEPRVRL